MAETALLLASFNIVAGIVSKIWELGETYYKRTKAWEDFKVKGKRLVRQNAVWLEEFKNYGISDKALIDSLKEATALIHSLTEVLTIEEERLQEEKRMDEAGKQRSGGRNCAWVTRASTIMFPIDVGRRTQQMEDALDAIRDLLNFKKEAKVATQNESLKMPYSLSFHNDIRYVPLEDTESKIHEELKKNSSGARPIVVFLFGGPGKGKSALARHVALHYNKLEKEEAEFSGYASFDQVIFLECGPEAKTSATQLELLQHLAVDINITEDKQPSTYTSDLWISQQVKRVIKSRQIFIIFDDVWEQEFLEHMIDIMCGSEVKCLVTSQKGDLCSGLDCSSITKIQIQDVSQEMARKIVASYVGFPNQDIPNQEILVEIDKMIEITNGNPLALASIVSSFSEDHREDLGQWKEANGMVTQALNAQPAHFLFSTKYRKTFWSTMQLSIRSLREESKKVLLLMDLCTGPSVPEEVILFLHQISTSEKQTVTFQKLASELVARGLVKINTNSSNIYPHEKSWSTHSLHKLFMEEDEGMQKKKREMFQSLKLGFSSALDNKLPLPSETVPEASEDADALLKAVFCALYLEDQFSKEAAAQLNIQDHDRFNDLRRKTFEPITRLLGQSMTQQWDSSTQAAAKQVFVQFFYKCEFDAENMSVLLKSAYPSAQLAAIQAICDICLGDERPLLEEGNQLLPSLLSFLGDSPTPNLQDKAAACLVMLTFERHSHGLQILNQEGAVESLVKALSNDPNPSTQKNAFWVLLSLATGSQCCALQILSNIRILSNVNFLENTHNSELQRLAASAIENLAHGPESCKRKIVKIDSLLATLVQSLLIDETPEVHLSAAKAFGHLAFGESPMKLHIFKQVRLLRALVKSVSKEKNPKLQEYAAGALSILACGPESCKRKIVEEDGVVAALVKSVSMDQTPELQSRAASALLNLASGEPPIKLQILKHDGLLEALVKSLSNEKNPKLQENAAWALSHLACGPESCKRKIVEEDGVVAALVKSVSMDQSPELQSGAASALLNLAAGEHPMKVEILKHDGLLEALVKSLSNEKNPRLQEYAARALSLNLACGPESCERKIVEEDGLLAALVKSLSLHQTPELQSRAASALRNLAAGEPPMKVEILKHDGLLEALVKCLLTEKNPKLQENAAWALSHLACGPESCKRKIMEEDGVVAALVKSVSMDQSPELQSRAASALLNLAAGEHPMKVEILKHDGLLEALVKSLSNEKNPRLQEYAARALSLNLACGPESCERKIVEEDGLLGLKVKGCVIQISN